jgi:tRNA-specific 2-thiouridylase
MRAAAHLRIPFLTLDLEKEYKEGVVDYMIREYGAGRVPNPDVMCNKHVKFGAFLDFAKKNGADFIATGHYTQIKTDNEQRTKNNENVAIHRLFAGADKEKDQSYFLWTLTQQQLAQTLFPVGHLQKTEVRALAHKYGLPNAEKKDSQGLCFMGAVDMAEFLKHYLDTTPGNVIDEEGNVIGTHDGALLYTIGQRHGFTTKKQHTSETPYFVISKDMQSNTLTVAHRIREAKAQDVTDVSITDLHLVTGETLSEQKEIKARIRYRGDLFPVSVDKAAAGDTSHVQFSETVEGVAPGQSIVFYRDEECLGGGIIEE